MRRAKNNFTMFLTFFEYAETDAGAKINYLCKGSSFTIWNLH